MSPNGMCGPAPMAILDETTPLPDDHVTTSKRPAPTKTGYTVKEQPIHIRRPLRVMVLGAGYSGILMGIIWSQKMYGRDAELDIYERNDDLGGTWLDNRYPGCKCDIPAHNYAYSFEPNLEWPNYYATSEQIYDYLKKVSKKYDVNKYIRFRHEVKEATWNEDSGKWKVQVEANGKVNEEICDIFINAGGVLNNWKWPDIEGLNEFQGRLFHSASWDQTYDFTGKKIAVIGNGSSAIQIVPKLADVVSDMTCFVRSRTWISPAPGINEPTENDPEMDENYNYSENVLNQFSEDPAACLEHCRSLMNRRLTNFRRTHAESDTQKAAKILFESNMRRRLGDSQKGKALADMLIPKFPVGCRRQTPGAGYLEALLQDNVETLWDDIDRITPTGILTKSGKDLQFDAIVCATGFDTTFRPRFPIKGRGGVDLGERWTNEESPKAYFGMTVPDFPNYFMFIGPASPISNGSLVQAIQLMGVYIWKCIDKIQTEDIKSLDITHGATDDFFEHTQKFLERTVWVGGCRSWYKRGTIDGPVIAIYGGTSFHYIEALRNPRWEDYQIDLLGGKEANRFSYLGNGFTPREENGGSVGETQTLTFGDYWKLFVLPDIYH